MRAAAQTIFFGVLVTFSFDSHHSSHKKAKSFFGMSTPHYIGVLCKDAVPYNFYGRLYIEDWKYFLLLHEKKCKRFFRDVSTLLHRCASQGHCPLLFKKPTASRFTTLSLTRSSFFGRSKKNLKPVVTTEQKL